MFPYYYDPTFIVLLPAILIASYAQIKVKSTFNKYSNYKSIRGIKASEVSRYLLDREGLYRVPVEIIGGNLTDHYDPRASVLRLSQNVYNSSSVAAIGVAAHEAGHAIQHNNKYLPLAIRNGLVPIANFGSNAAWFLILLAFITRIYSLIDIGIILFSFAVLFQIITLPVEFNASKRALKLLMDEGVLYEDEIYAARKVLNAAALTYVAAMLVSFAQLFRLLLLRRRND